MMKIKHIIVILLGLCLCSCYSKRSGVGSHHKKNGISAKVSSIHDMYGSKYITKLNTRRGSSVHPWDMVQHIKRNTRQGSSVHAMYGRKSIRNLHPRQDFERPQSENEALGGEPLGRLDPSQGVGGLGGDMDGIATGMGAGAEPLGLSKSKEGEPGMDEAGGAMQGLGEENEHLRGSHESLHRPFNDEMSQEGQDYIEGHGHGMNPNSFPGGNFLAPPSEEHSNGNFLGSPVEGHANGGNFMGAPNEGHSNGGNFMGAPNEGHSNGGNFMRTPEEDHAPGGMPPGMMPPGMPGNFMGLPGMPEDEHSMQKAYPPSDGQNFNNFLPPNMKHGAMRFNEDGQSVANNILGTAQMETQMTSPGTSELSAALSNNNMLDKVNIQGDRDVGELVRNAAKTKTLSHMNLDDLTKMNEASIVEPDFNMPKPPLLFNERRFSLHGQGTSKEEATKRRLQKIGKGKKFKKFKKLQ